MTELAVNDPMDHFVLPTDDLPIKFDGWLVGELDNGGGDRLRWAVLQLYRWYPVDGGDPGYILYTIGHSVIYHAPNSPCGRGVVTEVGSIEDITPEAYEDLEPCPECRPADLDDYAPSDLVEMEKVKYKHAECRSDEELLMALRREPRCGNCLDRPHEGRRCATCGCEDYAEAPRPISSPGNRLLAQVKHKLPSLAAVMKQKTVRL